LFDSEVVHIVVAAYFVDNYFLMFDRGVVHIYSQLQQYKPLLCQTSNSNSQQYNQPQQYEPLFCQTSNNNGRLVMLLPITV
jgi:hypothetical protein